MNGSGGIAVGMATSIPPHNLGEVCSGIIALIDNPHITIQELMEHIPGPDFPTGGIICGKSAIWKGYETGRSTVVVRSKTTIEKRKGDRYRIIINDIPYQQTRDPVIKKISDVANEGRISGISGVRDESDLKEPVRIVIDLKKDADPDVVLNQLYKFTPLQDIVLDHPARAGRRQTAHADAQRDAAGVRAASLHRHPPADAVPAVPRSPPQAHGARPAARARQHRRSDPRHPRVEDASRGQRSGSSRSKRRPRCSSARWATSASANTRHERGVAEDYSLTPVQAEAILKMTLGQLVNLEQEKLVDEHTKLLEQIGEYLGHPRRRSPQSTRIIREDCEELSPQVRRQPPHRAQRRRDRRRRPRRPHRRRNDGRLDLAQRLHQAHAGQRLPRPAPRRQRHQRRRRPTKKIRSSTCSSPARTTTCCSSPRKGKVYWQKVYNLPQLSRESKGRAVVNLLNLAEDEKIADCRAVRDFDKPDHYLMMATRKGLVKKTELKAYSRPLKSGIIAIKLKEDDELIDCRDHQDRATRSSSPPRTAWRSASAKPTPARWAATPAA